MLSERLFGCWHQISSSAGFENITKRPNRECRLNVIPTSWAVRKITFALQPDVWSREATWIPLRRGIDMSSKTRSGARLAAASKASSPFRAEPTITKSSQSNRATVSSISGASSASKTRAGSICPNRTLSCFQCHLIGARSQNQRNVNSDLGSSHRLRYNRHLALTKADSFSHTD